ncbi:MAG TPA: hypothetical protein VLM85_19600 [Polyangiaceae bacterium]|nr:hypothetical protein [Polyangiaceae bacterium]
MAAKNAKKKKKTASHKPAARKPAQGKKLAAKKAAPRKKAAPKKAAPKMKATPKKAAPKMKAAPKKKTAAKSKAVQRQDRAGHLAPRYAAGLRARSGKEEKEDVEAFLKGTRSEDDLAEGLGEEVIGKATTGEDEGEDFANQVVDEEGGGPFVVTTGGTEFADGVDESNPADAEREPFPTT